MIKPSKIKPGTKLMIDSIGGEYVAYFVRRIPRGGQQLVASNFLRVPSFVSLNGPDDDGSCEISDYDLSRKGRVVSR